MAKEKKAEKQTEKKNDTIPEAVPVLKDEPIIEKPELSAEELLVHPAEEPEEIVSAKLERREIETESWKPKTDMGKKVKSGEIKDINDVLEQGKPILETEIVDVLMPNMESDLLLVGQAKGKFGGGQRRVFKQTQKKTMEGNKPSFSTIAVVGNKDGIVGLGLGKARETVPAREKAVRNAKLNIIKIRRGCGSWVCNCKGKHSIPFTVTGKCGSVIIKLMPAPKGKGLIIEEECKKILNFAGINDVWSKTYGKGGTKMNLIMACEAALKQLMETKIHHSHLSSLGIIEGASNEMPSQQDESQSDKSQSNEAKHAAE